MNSTHPAYKYLEENRVTFSLLIVLIVVIALIVLMSVLLYRSFSTKKIPKIRIPYLVTIGIVDLVAITAILYFAIPRQLSLYGPSLWVPLVVVLVAGLAYLIFNMLTSASKSREGAHSRRQPAS
jgi:hypothetical protein